MNCKSICAPNSPVFWRHNQGGKAGTEAYAILQSSSSCCLALVRWHINCHIYSCHRHIILCQHCSCRVPSQQRNKAGSSRAVNALDRCSCLFLWGWIGALGTRKVPETFRLKAAGFPYTAYHGQGVCLLVTTKATQPRDNELNSLTFGHCRTTFPLFFFQLFYKPRSDTFFLSRLLFQDSLHGENIAGLVWSMWSAVTYWVVVSSA